MNTKAEERAWTLFAMHWHDYRGSKRLKDGNFVTPGLRLKALTSWRTWKLLLDERLSDVVATAIVPDLSAAVMVLQPYLAAVRIQLEALHGAVLAANAARLEVLQQALSVRAQLGKNTFEVIGQVEPVRFLFRINGQDDEASDPCVLLANVERFASLWLWGIVLGGDFDHARKRIQAAQQVHTGDLVQRHTHHSIQAIAIHSGLSNGRFPREQRNALLGRRDYHKHEADALSLVIQWFHAQDARDAASEAPAAEAADGA